jgi:hypothetical protein
MLTEGDYGDPTDGDDCLRGSVLAYATCLPVSQVFGTPIPRRRTRLPGTTKCHSNSQLQNSKIKRTKNPKWKEKIR